MTLVAATAEQQASFSKLTGLPSRDTIKVLSASEVAASRPPEWRVKGILPRQGLAAIYGAPGCGKSFLALDMSFAIASGREWFGRTKPCPVLYVAAEAGGSMGMRIKAHFLDHGDELSAPVSFITTPVDLFIGTDLQSLIAAVKKVLAEVVIIDTLARSTSGADENSPADMGVIVRNVSELARDSGALVVVIHHSGKDAAKGPRGHSALIAAIDTAIEVVKDASGYRSWKLAKSRDGQDGAEHPFKLQPIVIGMDSDGDAITSCVVAPDEDRPPKGEALSAVGGAVLAHLRELGTGIRMAELVKHFDGIFSRSSIFSHVGKLVEAGRLTKVGNIIGVTNEE